MHITTAAVDGRHALQGAFRGLGDTRTPLFATLLCTVLSLGLDVLLIFTLGWGVAGSAWATVLAEARTHPDAPSPPGCMPLGIGLHSLALAP